VSKPVARYWMTKDKHGNVVQGKERRRLLAPCVRLTLALAACVAAPAGVDGMPAYDGYDAFWKTLPDPLFTIADEKPLDDPQSFEGQAFRAWGPILADGARPAAGEHRVEILGSVVTIDHHAFPFTRAAAFPGEVSAEPGSDARLFVGLRDVCVQGTAPTSSGTAQRHVHVALVTDAFTAHARRHDLPSLFGSCLALTRGANGDVRFPEGTYHVSADGQANDGVVFKTWLLRDGRFVKTGEALRIRFPDPGNVHRFSVVAP
jgi:hypothetical protein